EELAAKNAELDSQKTELDLLNEKISLVQSDYESSSDLYSEQSALYNQQNISLHQQKSKISGLEKDLEYKEIQLENIESRIDQHQNELNKLELSLREVIYYVDLSDDELKFMYEQRNALTQGLSEIEKQYFTLRKKINDVEDALNTQRRNKEHSDVLLNELKEKSNEIRLNLGALSERISVEFNLDSNEILHTSNHQENEDELRDKTSKLKKQLDEFGAINPLAMESFKEMDERYAFIKKEKEELLEAKDSLLTTIREIDATAK